MSDPSTPTPSLTDLKTLEQLLEMARKYAMIDGSGTIRSGHAKFLLAAELSLKARLQAEAKAEPRDDFWANDSMRRIRRPPSLGERLAEAKAEPAAGMPTPEKFADAAVNWLCELPDRDSPEDWPEACLVTVDELHDYLVEQLTPLLQGSSVPAPQVTAEIEEIAKRHEAANPDSIQFANPGAAQAHRDRATLLAAITGKPAP